MFTIHVLATCAFLLTLSQDIKTLSFEGISKRSINSKKDCNCDCGVGSRQIRVVGGNVTKIHEFPWVAGLRIAGDFLCGASLITRRHLVTAAHCVNGYDRKDVSVVLADHDRDSGNRLSYIVLKGVKQIRQHEAFDPNTYNNDIAILELETPVKYGNTIQPACLPDPGIHDFAGRLAVVTGWGRTAEQEETSHVLRKVVLRVWSKKDCYHNSGYAENKLSENMFCAGYPEGKLDACQGDSGGPLHIKDENGKMVIIGLVSWGRGCARPNFPGIYTKVVNYIDWINDSLQEECICSFS